MINHQLIKPLTIGLVSSIFFVLVFNYGIIGQIDKPFVDRPNAEEGDLFLQYFLLEQNFSKFSTLEFNNYFDTRMFYPLRNTLALGELFITQSVMALPVYMITKNAIIATNSLFILNAFLSFLGMYLLTFYLTKSISGGIIAGLFYTYNPFVWAHMTQLQVISIQWIPLIFLVTEMLVRTISVKLIIILCLLFLIQLNSSLYYLYFLILLWPLYFAIRVYQEKMAIGKFLPKFLIIGAFAGLIGGAIFLKPYIEAKSEFMTNTSLGTVNKVSAKLTDFMFTSEGNRLYGWMVTDPFFKSLRGSYAADHTTEHTAFPGLVVLLLFGAGLYLFFKNREILENKKFIIAALVLLIISLILSFGPYIEIANFRIPSIYLLLFQIIPFADSFRAVSRFVVISNLSLALIIASGWQVFSERVKKPAKLLLVVIIIILMCLEYQNKPFPRYNLNQEILQFYSWLESQKNIKVIVEIPVANGPWNNEIIRRDFFLDTRYLLYGTLHSKKIVNGYSSFVPPQSIALGDFISLDFPNSDSLSLLKEMGVDAIIVHIDQYANPNWGNNVIFKLRAFRLKEAYKSENIHAFVYE